MGSPPGDGPVVDVSVQQSLGASAVTASGNVYDTGNVTTWRYLGNIFGSGPIAVDPSTMGKVKEKYRDE